MRSLGLWGHLVPPNVQTILNLNVQLRMGHKCKLYVADFAGEGEHHLTTEHAEQIAKVRESRHSELPPVII